MSNHIYSPFLFDMSKKIWDTYDADTQAILTEAAKAFGEEEKKINRQAAADNLQFVNVTYIKGCLMMDCLRIGIGDDRFFEGLQNYYAEFSGKIATAADLAGVYERLGCDTNSFFAGFLDGKVIL